jgi:hypothetical protein
MWYNQNIGRGEVNVLTREGKIRLLVSKSYAYKTGYQRAVEEGDTEAAEKWKAGYRVIVDRINELKGDISDACVSDT